jgi:hypothetical protein
MRILPVEKRNGGWESPAPQTPEFVTRENRGGKANSLRTPIAQPIGEVSCWTWRS